MTEPPAYGPLPPGLPPGEPTGFAVPRQVQRAAYCLYGLGALHLASMALGFFALDSAREAALRNDPDLTESELSGVVQASIVFSLVTALIFVGVYVLSGRKMLAGRTWGRVLGTVLAGLELAFGLVGLLGGALSGARLTDAANLRTVLITMAAVALSAAFLVLAWSGPATAFFGRDGLNGPPGQS